MTLELLIKRTKCYKEVVNQVAEKTILIEDLEGTLDRAAARAAKAERILIATQRKLAASEERLSEMARRHADDLERVREQHRDQLEAVTKLADRFIDATAPRGPSSLVIQEPSAEAPPQAVGQMDQMIGRINDIYGEGLSVDEMIRRRDASMSAERARIKAELDSLR